MIKQLLFLSVLVCLLSSCNDEEKSYKLQRKAVKETLDFEIDDETTVFDFDSIFKKESIIKLKGALVGSVEKVRYFNKSIYLFDGTDYSLKVYD